MNWWNHELTVAAMETTGKRELPGILEISEVGPRHLMGMSHAMWPDLSRARTRSFDTALVRKTPAQLVSLRIVSCRWCCWQEAMEKKLAMLRRLVAQPIKEQDTCPSQAGGGQ